MASPPMNSSQGSPPLTVTDMVTLSTQPLKKLKKVDQELINTIRTVTKENVELARENRAERVRRNVLTMDVTLNKSRKRATDIKVQAH